MPITTIADMQIVPSKFASYIITRTTEKSIMVRSGVTTEDPTVSQVISGTPKGGNLITMPYYNPLTGEDEVFGEQDIEIDKITTDNEIATMLIRQRAWGDTDLATVFGGSDPLSAVGELVSDWWLMREQVIMLSILKGILSPTGGALKSHILDVSMDAGTDSVIDVDNTLDAKQLMGDAADKLGLVFMHSATYTKLQKAQKIDSEYDSDLKIKIDYYLGYLVMVDDGMPVASGVYDTYFLGKGVFARNDGMPQGLVGVETDRNKINASNYLINRRALVMHPRGVSWKADATLTGNRKYAANADLAKASNWILKKHHKNIPIVCLRHKIEANPIAP